MFSLFYHNKIATAVMLAALCFNTEGICEEISEAPVNVETPSETPAAEEKPRLSFGKRAKRWVRNMVITDEDEAKFGLKFECEPSELSTKQPLVVMIHGFNSWPDCHAALAGKIADAEFRCASFVYPNDYYIDDSAERLSRELKTLRENAPEVRVVLVTHSMGGLVARACIENPDLNPGNVDKLIMVAPPSQGTRAAHFAIGTDLWEYGFDRKEMGFWERVRSSIVDGLGEAADDLQPNSEFLNRMDHCKRNPQVEYTIVLGTEGPISEEKFQSVRQTIRNAAKKTPGMKELGERLERLVADFEEVVIGRGDGIVSVRRGKLADVRDTHILPFGHLSVMGIPTENGVQPAQAIILHRIAAEN